MIHVMIHIHILMIRYKLWYKSMILTIHVMIQIHDTHDTSHDTLPWYSRYTLWYKSMILMIQVMIQIHVYNSWYTSWYKSMILMIHFHDTHYTRHDTNPWSYSWYKSWYTSMILMIHIVGVLPVPPCTVSPRHSALESRVSPQMCSPRVEHPTRPHTEKC